MTAAESKLESPSGFGEIGKAVVALLLAIAAEALDYFAPDTLPFKGLGMALAAAAIALSGFSTYRKGLAALGRGQLNMNALMGVAVTGAFLIGQWPEAAMVMALYAIAELIEARSVDRARNALQGLLALAPDTAEISQPDGSWREMPADQVSLGAQVRVKPGARIPLDGRVTVGNSAVNQAPVTGESIPVDKTIGDPLFAGTINETGTLVFEVTAVAGNTTLSRIIHAVEKAQGTRAPTQRFVDRFAAIYTPAVFVIALAIALLGPWLFGWTMLQAVYKALVLLVIACPCQIDAMEAKVRHLMVSDPTVSDLHRQTDYEFHALLGREFGNAAVAQTVAALHRRTCIFDHTQVPERFVAGCQEHLDILEAARSGNADLVEARLRAHLEHARDAVLNRLRRAGAA